MTIYETVYSLARELTQLARADFNPVRLLVVGCSTSEVGGGTIGHASSPDLGQEIARAVLDAAGSVGFAPAFQCCEHLNRALVIEREIAERYGLPVVFAVPHPKAGGSCASAAYRLMRDPVLVSSLSADAGMDIGQTLIGMHLRAVAVPVRLSMDHVGDALLTCARTRPPLIGGERAKYSL